MLEDHLPNDFKVEGGAKLAVAVVPPIRSECGVYRFGSRPHQVQSIRNRVANHAVIMGVFALVANRGSLAEVASREPR